MTDIILTDRQKECLRLVAKGYQDKEIAREVGIHHETVRKHLKSAMARMGTNSRFVAARLLADDELHGPSRVPPARAIPKHCPVDARPGAAVFDDPKGLLEAAARGNADDVLREERVPYRRTADSDVGPADRDRHSVGTASMGRLAAAAMLTLLIAMAVISAIPMSNAVQQLANAIDPP